MFNLEQLKQKKQPKEKPKFIIQINKPTNKRKVDYFSEEENEKIEEVDMDLFSKDREPDEFIKKRLQVAIIDKRQNVAINRELVLERIRDKMDIFAVKKADKRVIETTPQTKIPIVEEPIIDLPSQATEEEEDLEKEDLEKEDLGKEDLEKEDLEKEDLEKEDLEKEETEEEEVKALTNEEEKTRRNLEEAEQNLEKTKQNMEKAKENVGKKKEKIDIIKKKKKEEKDKERKAMIEEELLKANEELKEANEELKNAKEENEEANKVFKAAKKENDEANKKLKNVPKKQKKTDEPDNKKRKTQKNYAIMQEMDGLDKNMKINNVVLKDRFPKKEKVIVKTSSFYLNNRKKYIQRVNEMLKPYQTEMKEMENKEASCDRGKNTDITLFLHQRIVREYLNVITPYRGLLLYHGLGSGKTCTSIGIAEGMKTSKPIILMTPASLKMNYFSQLKKCGDPMYKKNQFWEFVSTEGKPEYIPVFSQVLQIPREIIEQKRGAWLVDVTKKQSNYESLSTAEQKELDNQLNLMIRSKYTDINYNGITKKKLAEMTEDFTINPFDNKTVIIDEAHNFVSRIVNKLKSSKSTSYLLYDYLMKATNTKIVLLTGTPIINYPNEIGVLFNILRGYIKTWTFQLGISPDAPPGFKLNAEEIVKMFHRSKMNTYDYIEFTNNKLVITRNPFGFVHVDKQKATKPRANENKGGELINIFGGGITEAKNEFFETNCRKINLKKHLLDGFSVAREGKLGGSPIQKVEKLLKNPNKRFSFSKKKQKLRKTKKNFKKENDVYRIKNGMIDLNEKKEETIFE
jgi:chemotaxis protein histidine kinase CheA